ncbi:ABC transporter permease [bacterium]|nr:ABC transporter permease [candidate division CSSED10-310 bacterium]
MNITESLIDGIVDIRHHGFRTFLQALGIVLGVTSVVATISMLDSGNKRSMEIYEEMGSLKQIVAAPDWRGRVSLQAVQKAAVPLDLDDADRIAKLHEFVEGVEPVISRYWPVQRGKYKDKHRVQAGGLHVLEQNGYALEQGRAFTMLDLRNRSRVAILGSAVARAAFGTAEPLGKAIYINGKGFTVVGVLKEKVAVSSQHQRNFLAWMNWNLFIPLDTMAGTMLNSNAVHQIKIILKDLSQFEAAKQAVDSILKRRRNGVSNYNLYSAKERIETQKKEMMALNITFSVVGAISLIVGGVVIMNILLAAFNERIREVGVRKALGATWLDIIAQFLVESVLITVIGGVAGILLGVLAVRIIAVLSMEEFWVTSTSVLLAFLSSVGTGIFFGFYPAIKAARLNPIEALRYE